MRIDLSGKRAIVTGSTHGIGFAVAIGLAEAGAHVVINGRGQAGVDDALTRFKARVPGAKVEGIAADLATKAGADAFVARAGDADILVNNLGIFEPKAFVDISDEDWMRFFETNVLSGIRMARHYFPKMVAKNWGRIVFVSSESALNIPPEMIHYGMTKTAQLAVARGLAKTARGTGVTVNSVLPGPTKSEGVEVFFKQMAEKQGIPEAEAEKGFMEKNRPSSIIARAAAVEEIASMIVYVCSPQASATTGASLRVDGGLIDTIA